MDKPSEIRKLRENNKVLEGVVRDFMSYFDPKGGISDVPLGPFQRADEVLTRLRKEDGNGTESEVAPAGDKGCL